MKGRSHPTHSKRLGPVTQWGAQILALGRSCLSTTPWWFKTVTLLSSLTQAEALDFPLSSYADPSRKLSWMSMSVLRLFVNQQVRVGIISISLYLVCNVWLTPWLGKRRIYRTSFCTNTSSFIYANLAGGWGERSKGAEERGASWTGQAGAGHLDLRGRQTVIKSVFPLKRCVSSGNSCDFLSLHFQSVRRKGT